MAQKARPIKTWRDRCHYRGNTDKCPICRNGHRPSAETWNGRRCYDLTECQLYVAAGEPKDPRSRYVFLALTFGVGVLLAQTPHIIKWLIELAR